ncbi:MAG: glycosyl hydrolase [Blastopirellula sp.]|nr:MAG: glycosyl hydrolase [Blastopirellula sp.]
MIRTTFFSIAIALSILLNFTDTAFGQSLDLVDVFSRGDDGYHTYRIPAIVCTKQGTLLAFSEGRKDNGSDHGDIDLVLKRSSDNGKTWNEQTLVYEEGDTKKITIGNPCPVVDQQTGHIHMVFNRDNRSVLVTHSEDDGKTWSKPRDITSTTKLKDWDWYATGPGNGIQLTQGPNAGRLVMPCDHRVTPNGTAWKQAGRSHIIYSDDHGKTWELGGVTDWAMNESAVAEMENGDLLLNMRSYRELGQRGITFSKNSGKSWGPTRNDATLIESVCQGSFIKYNPPGNNTRSWYLFSNPATTKGRHHMTVRLSIDDAQTWSHSRLIYEKSAAYSNLVQLPNGNVGILFERDGYAKISFTQFSIDWIKGTEK